MQGENKTNIFRVTPKWSIVTSTVFGVLFFVVFIGGFTSLLYFQLDLGREIVNYAIAVIVLVFILGMGVSLFSGRKMEITSQYIQFSRKSESLNREVISKEAIRALEVGKYHASKHNGWFMVKLVTSDNRNIEFQILQGDLKLFYQKWLEFGYTPMTGGVDYKQFKDFLNTKKKKVQIRNLIVIGVLFLFVFFADTVIQFILWIISSTSN